MHYDTKYLTKEMKQLILKTRLLTEIRNRKTYPYALVKDLQNSDLQKYFGSELRNKIYGALNELERERLIKVEVEVDRNKLRRYYFLTSSGREVTSAIRTHMNGYMKEIKRTLEE